MAAGKPKGRTWRAGNKGGGSDAAGSALGESSASVQSRLGSLSRMATISSIVAAAAVGAALITGGLSYSKVQAMEASTVSVVCAATEIEAGDELTADKLKVVNVPSAYVVEGATSSVADVVPADGTRVCAAHDIAANEQMTESSKTQAYKLSAQLDPGTYAVTIPVDGTATMSGMLKVGDFVDIYTADGATVAEDMEILALDAALTGDGELTSSYSNLTFQVEKAQGKKLMDEAGDGGIKVMLHSSKTDAAATAAGLTASE